MGGLGPVGEPHTELDGHQTAAHHGLPTQRLLRRLGAEAGLAAA